MKVFKNLFGRGDKIHVDEIAVAPGLLLGGAVIVDEGSNANGEWTRWGNGWQMCLVVFSKLSGSAPNSSLGSIYRSQSNLTWEYPQPFYKNPVVDGVSSASTWPNSTRSPGGDDRFDFLFRIFSPVSSANNVDVRLSAIGRWK